MIQFVNVFDLDAKPTAEKFVLPDVFKTPIRPDVVNFVHDQMSKNKRQPYAVSELAGHQTSAESWGTGRAVARIPRVRGGGTHRSGQGAFGNMCRGGHMFAPTKVYRRWHRRINTCQKRVAVAGAVAATGVTALVMSRGHCINRVPQIPLVINDKMEKLTKTKQAILLLRKIRAIGDVKKVYKSQRLRAGKGKMRNRRRIQRKGPLIIYNRDRGLVKAFRNIPGVDLQSVKCLNLLKLAPGGHVGRFVIWTKSAFCHLDRLFGTYKEPSKTKKNFSLPFPKMTNTDLVRLLQSDEIQKAIRAPIKKVVRRKRRNNPLRNHRIMHRLNPYAKVLHRKNQMAAKKMVKKTEDAEKVVEKKPSLKKVMKKVVKIVGKKPVVKKVKAVATKKQVVKAAEKRSGEEVTEKKLKRVKKD